MSLFMSPVKLFNTLTAGASMNQEVEQHPRNWYFSKEGEEAYNNAKTVPEKVELYYSYLSLLKGEDADKEFLQAIAYIMATSMEGTSKPYGSWPAIIDENINPLVNYALSYVEADMATLYSTADENGLEYSDLAEYQKQRKIAMALAAVRGENYELFMQSTKNAYENLTKKEEDIELFLIERYIIFTLCDKYYETEYGIGPYIFGLELGAEEDE